MSNFIEIKKMVALREAAKKGDKLAATILRKQLNGEDFDDLLNHFFANQGSAPQSNQVVETRATQPTNIPTPQATKVNPTPQPQPVAQQPMTDEQRYPGIKDPRLIAFLKRNDVKYGDMEYQDTIDTFYEEFPNLKPEGYKSSSGEKHTSIYEEGDGNENYDFNEPVDKSLPTPSVPSDNASIYDDEDEVDESEYMPQPKQEKNFIDALIEDEVEAINAYNSAIMKIMSLDEQSDATRKGARTELEEIRNDEMEHLEKLKRLKLSLEKKEEADNPNPIN